MEIDIRKRGFDKVDSIRFGDHNSDIVEIGRDRFVIAAAHEGSVLREDIDNLILALKKAKELWG